MSHSLACNYIHLIFSTKYRENIIHETIEPALYGYIKGTCENKRSPVLVINGMPDHIHILLKQSKNISISELVREIKQQSSKWMKTHDTGHPDFYWQTGYAAFSVSPQNIDKVFNYILNQKEHHKKESFKEEYIAILKQSKVEFNEKYIWD